MPTARNGDVELSYRVRGQGPALLLIHGLAHGQWGWFGIPDSLAHDHTVITFDNRGVGGSTVVTSPYTAHDMADDAVAVLDAAGVDLADVFGVSLGGVVTMSLAARYPDRVRRLVLVATHHGGPDRVPIPDDVVQLVLDPHEGLTPEQRLRKVAPVSFRPGWPEQDPDRWEEIIQIRLANQMPAEAFYAQAGAGATDVSDCLDAIKAPTLVIAGTADRFVPAANAQLIADRLPDARVALIEGAGHQVNVEEPERLVALIREHCG